MYYFKQPLDVSAVPNVLIAKLQLEKSFLLTLSAFTTEKDINPSKDYKTFALSVWQMSQMLEGRKKEKRKRNFIACLKFNG